MTEDDMAAFKKALYFEKKGHKIYTDTAKKTKNSIVKKTFSYLAEQEMHHIEEIEQFLQKNKIELKGDNPKETKEFFKMTADEFKKKTELSDDDIKAHEVALELEQSSYDFYKEEYEKTNNKDLKKFFKFLMEQENAHYEFVQKTYEFIKNPVGFYTEQEKWMADGG